jgi:hypothetical protein
MKFCSYAILAFFVLTVPAFAGVSISSPTQGEHVSSPFYLAAHATSCSSQPISSIGYSLDNSSYTAVQHGSSSLATNVKASAGTHTVHVKAWNIYGTICVTDVGVTVTSLSTTSTTSTSTSGISIGSPSNGQSVSSPFSLIASASYCKSQSVRSMGYSLDNSSYTTVLRGSTSMNVKVSASAGTHTVHVKTWGMGGSACASQVGVTVSKVTDDVVGSTSIVPSNTTKVSSIEVLKNWKASHDTGANGYATGQTSVISSPSYSGAARKFVTKHTSSGAERYSVAFADNRTATNFFYDGWVYLTSSASHIANIEMDVNQTMPNGQTVIFGVQCSGYTGTWEYTANLGTPQNPKGKWLKSSAPCNPRNWTRYKWHHVQMSYSRNSTGYVTYKYVWFDGHRSTLNHTVLAARALGWGSTVSTNFQIDGLGTGTTTVYLDALTIHRW